MALASACIAVCAPLTSIASVLLFMMAHMLRSGNWTFEVLAAKHSWRKDEKANVCRRGALLYLFTSLTLWVLMLLQAPMYRLWSMMPWSKSVRREGDEYGQTREGLLATEGAAGGRAGSRAARHASAGSYRPLNEDATEMSALDWGQEGLAPAAAQAKVNVLASANGGSSSPLGANGAELFKGATAAGASTSPHSRRFPDFLRSLANGAPRGSNDADEVDDAYPIPTAAATTTVASGAWGRARGLRSRGPQGPAAEPQSTVTIHSDLSPPGPINGGAAANGTASSSVVSSTPPLLTQQQQLYNAHANLWSGSGGEQDSVDDAEFLSDVELDGTRHHSLRQIRASGWGMQRTTAAAATAAGVVVEASGGPAAPTRRHRSRANGPLQLEVRSRSGHTSPNGVSNRNYNNGGGGGPVGAATAAAPMLTTLWPTATNNANSSNSHSNNNNASSRSISPTTSPQGARQQQQQQQRGFPSAGPPPAMQRQKNKHL